METIMTNQTVFLVGLDEASGKAARVPSGDDLHSDLKKLFEKLFGKSFGAVKWWAGIPGKDVAVVWQGTPWQGSEQYWLHVSYSDQRTW
jgi:hypothetical protein